MLIEYLLYFVRAYSSIALLIPSGYLYWTPSS